VKKSDKEVTVDPKEETPYNTEEEILSVSLSVYFQGHVKF
jgi:hypothetical protein